MRRIAVTRRFVTLAVGGLLALALAGTALAAEPPAPGGGTPPAPAKIDGGDTAWMLVSCGLVLVMVPGLALFYGGMVRRKNVLTTMMQSMVALALVGVYWFAIGYSLAFGPPVFTTAWGSIIGFDVKLVFLQDVEPYQRLPGTSIPIYLHMLYQGMFAIITPALISGAVAERIRFKPYCVFLILWITFVYCPLAHCVWAQDWWTGDGTK